MYIDDQTFEQDGTTKRRVLLRDNYKVKKGKYKKVTIANLSKLSDKEIEAMKVALKHKDVTEVQKLIDSEYENGTKIGAIITLYQVAKELGIVKVLGKSRKGKLALWLIIAQILGAESRLSKVRLAREHAVAEILNIDSFSEDDLYATLDWLYDNKAKIERGIYKQAIDRKDKDERLFLYDVSSSYLEGDKNDLAAWGYNRDKKKGKKQIVYGLLTLDNGDPVGVDVFKGNTSDTKTFPDQIKKVEQLFECKDVTFVGDGGMIQGPQIEELENSDFDYTYITSISKKSIRKLCREDSPIEYSLFDKEIAEVIDKEEGLRYILRQNPVRVKELKKNRRDKIEKVETEVSKSNNYLSEHPGAKVSIQLRDLRKLIKKLKLSSFLSVEESKDDSRKIIVKIDTEKKQEAAKFDGCYVIKTNLSEEKGDKNFIHDRYKYLSKVEYAFRTCKSDLDIRPLHLRNRERTIASILVSMLSYKIERHLRDSWSDLDITVLEGIKKLESITSIIIELSNETKLQRVPKPNQECKKLLNRVNVKIPTNLPYRDVEFVTRHKVKKEE